MRRKELTEALRGGAADAELAAVYGPEAEAAKPRMESVIRGFCERLDPEGSRELYLFSAPGRTELGGNHSDHQGGWGLAAAVNMDTLACAARNAGPVIRVISRGHDPVELDLRSAGIREDERSRSAALVRGIAARLREQGYPVGGFDAYTETSVLRGSGLSSSAAFEILMGQIMNQLFCGGALGFEDLAKLGQYAENVYYGKPCGLLDQLSCAAGGVIAVDFADPERPLLRRCGADFAAAGYALAVIDSGANHSELDVYFAAIRSEMEAVAGRFGKTRLRDVDEAGFYAARGALRAELGERPVLRAEHYFEETRRAQAQYEALAAGDLGRYLALVRESARSSEEKLQNVFLDRTDGGRLLRVIRRARELAGEGGAARVHGGGFAGTAQAYVPLERLDGFVSAMEEEFGAGRCHIIRVRPCGSILFLKEKYAKEL